MTRRKKIAVIISHNETNEMSLQLFFLFTAPEGREFCHPGGVIPHVRIHRKCRFYSDAVTVPPAAYFFLSCQKKVCKKEALDAK